MKFKGKRVLVYGLGDSGRAAIKVLRKHFAYVSFYDDNLKFLEYVGFERNPMEQKFDFVVVSPGIKCINNPLIEHFKQQNTPIYSELDLAYMLSKGKIVAITGTNGKTTVSMLTNKILKAAGYETFLCGNIGIPFSLIAEKTTKKSIIVCEVSNFQLEMSSVFHANIACVLNIQPDHLDRHGTFEEYVRVKGKICQNMTKKDTLILNFDDENAKKIVLHKKFMYFSKKKLKKGVSVQNNAICLNKKPLFATNEIRLLGEKNLENVLASVAICTKFKVSPQSFVYAISNFVPASHRMEFVAEIAGVTFIDDSKATNVASTIACVEAFSGKNILLLMGGQGKEIDYGVLFERNFPIKQVICFGQDGENIEKSAKEFGYPTFRTQKFDDAVRFAQKVAKSGDFVLLSPACASFDEFSSYAERGERFKEIVVG